MGLRRSLTLSAGSLSSRFGERNHTTKTRFSSLSLSNEYRRNVNEIGKDYDDKSQALRSQDSEKTLFPEECVLDSPQVIHAQETPLLKIGKSEIRPHQLAVVSTLERDRSSVELSIPKKKPTREYAIDPLLEYDEESFEEIPRPPTENFHENAEEEQLDVSAYLVPCDICSRKFMSDRLVGYSYVGQASSCMLKSKFETA
jgi:hypothetical protein